MPEEKISERTDISPLIFSADTILFDTIFTSRGSITKRLIVKNPNETAVEIQEIRLAKTENSSYTIFVNGAEGHNFQDHKLMGQDSMLILVEVAIDPNDDTLPFLVKDSITFSTNSIFQEVKLVAYGQNAHFLNDSILACNTTWSGKLPYVISNSILVDEGCELTIDKGVRIFSDNNSFIFVKGSLIVDGDVDEPVRFGNTRMDKGYENAPGQWGGIIFLPGSQANHINYAEIRNAVVGLNLDTFDEDDIPEITISNTIIENMSRSGILTIGADVYAYNTLVNNCAEFLTGNFGGGNHIYTHCTLANVESGFFRQNPSVVFTNNFEQEDLILISDINVEITNSIVWGDLNEELFFDTSADTDVSLFLTNSLFKTQLDLDVNGNIINLAPRFVEATNYNYRLDVLSPAKDKGLATSVLLDLAGNSRDSKPDLGAYEIIE